MLILKGNRGKSRIADIVFNETCSRCFVYYDYPILNNSICLSSAEYSLDDFKECITLYHNNNVYPDVLYDYLIIYTNQTEESLKDFIKWLKSEVSLLISYRDIIVMCQ